MLHSVKFWPPFLQPRPIISGSLSKVFSLDLPKISSPFFSVLLDYRQSWLEVLPPSCLFAGLLVGSTYASRKEQWWIWKPQQHFMLLFSSHAFLHSSFIQPALLFVFVYFEHWFSSLLGFCSELWHKLWGPFIVYQTFLWGQSELENLFTPLMPRMVHCDAFCSYRFYFLFLVLSNRREKVKMVRAGEARRSKRKSGNYFYLGLL